MVASVALAIKLLIELISGAAGSQWNRRWTQSIDSLAALICFNQLWLISLVGSLLLSLLLLYRVLMFC